MLRTCFSVIVLGAMTFWCGAGCILARLLGEPDVPGGVYDRMLRRWSRSICRAAGVRVVVHDEQVLAGGEPRVFVANHLSGFDILALGQVLPHQKFVAKSELKAVPFFGWAASMYGVIWVERDNRRSVVETYAIAGAQIRNGVSVAVFPEGTRGDQYELRAFKKGPFVLAIASGAAIVPTVIHGSREAQSRTDFTIRPATIHLHFLPPIPTAGLSYDDRDDLARRTRDAMAACLEREYGIRSVPSDRVRSVKGVSHLAPEIVPST